MTNKGFTLIELLIVIAIIGILSTIASPLYSEHVLKTQRVEGKSALVQLQLRMESHLLNRNSYADAHIGGTVDNDMVWPTNLSESGFYELKISAQTAFSYTIQAIPQGKQANDLVCGSLQIDNTGTKSITGTGTSADCWY